MKYKEIKSQILEMKCNKIYKPILLLAFCNYMKIVDETRLSGQFQVDLNHLIPIIRNLLANEQFKDCSLSCDIENLSEKQLTRIIIDGPLYRIENEVPLFTASKSNPISFGLRTDNPSINLSLLIETVEQACIDLIYKLTSVSLSPFNPTYYKQAIIQVEKTKIDPSGKIPKIYKYLLILSLLSYYRDLKLVEYTFNNPVSVELLAINYQLLMSEELFGNLIENEKLKGSTSKAIQTHISSMPLRKLCKPNTIFKNNDKNPKSRKLENLPTEFWIECPEYVDQFILASVLEQSCSKMIEIKTGQAQDLSIIDLIRESSEADSSNSSVRKGQQLYRRSLLERYNHQCVLCSIDFDPMLVASHAKPWRSCLSTHEKLSPNNGLLLCSKHDSLFDKGYITFDPEQNYKVVYSPLVSENVISSDHLTLDNRVVSFVEDNYQMKKYLDYHRNNIFKC